MTTLDAMVDCLFGLPSLQDVAVEFRAGKLCGRDKRFISTLTEPDFQIIYGQVKRQCKVTCETDYMYDQGRYNKSRLSVNDEGVVTSALHKERIGSFDMETNLPFDIRVNIARDTPISPLPATIDDDYCKKRAKTRFTIDAKDWVVALIESTACDESTTYELVVEVKLASITACADHRAAASLLGSVFVEVCVFFFSYVRVFLFMYILLRFTTCWLALVVMVHRFSQTSNSKGLPAHNFDSTSRFVGRRFWVGYLCG